MAMSIDDPGLVESFRAGENEAFELLMRAHRPALYRHAMRRLSDHASAEDAVQETFTRAYRSRARVGDDWRLSAWLHQILANVCIDEANRRRRELDKSGRWAVTDMPSRGIAPDLDLQLGLDVDHSNVVEALQQLPDNYQEALSLRYVAEMEYDEIAEVLEVSEENARARVSRASKAMRLLLRPVAAFIAFLSTTLFRRGDKAAKAMPFGDSVNASTNASMYSSLVETAQAVAVQAPHAMPLISKAAIGIGAAIVASAPVTAPVVIDQFRADETESNRTIDGTDPSLDAPVIVDVDGSSDGGSTDVASPAVELGAIDDGVSSETPVFIPGESPTPEYGAQSAADAGVVTDVVPTTVLVDPLVNPTALPGSLFVGSLELTSAGSRLDLSGSTQFSVGDSSSSGQLSGRLAFMSEPDESGRRRIDALLIIQFGTGSLEIRLAGYASGNESDGYALTGRFRSTGIAELLPSGTFSGVLGTTLTLSLAA